MENNNINNIIEQAGKTRGIAISIIDMFEDLLDKHNIDIPDDYRSGDDTEAHIYGDTYYALEDEIVELLSEYIDE